MYSLIVVTQVLCGHSACKVYVIITFISQFIIVSGTTMFIPMVCTLLILVIQGYTPLTAACWRGSTKIAQMLIEKGANPNKHDRVSEPNLNAFSSYITRDAWSHCFLLLT